MATVYNSSELYFTQKNGLTSRQIRRATKKNKPDDTNPCIKELKIAPAIP